MADPETDNHEEPTFPSKRKPDQEDTHDFPNKSPKITTALNDNNSQESEVPTTTNSSSDAVPVKESGGDDEDDDIEPENDTDDDDDDEDDEEDDSEGERVVDRKGKGILRDDKGKGKLIEEDDDDDEDDDSDDSDDSDDDSDGNVSGSDSDFSDDPLAEVDLDNILPSRTRRRPAYSGVHISGGAGQ
ncbi:unnamed protein product [Lathyrus oleraceus]|nr:uncharacterized protein LOC127126772 [Pisum sativum]XP_050911721.1 uncharacterized protein LOC127126772 [Pisum sativum]